ncbi:PadR family transcriptional regulator [Cellulomonas xiejunii]|uniref:PadR family transcriptional regulator n=1 Tax=Cellulomonas xiejunii TaxID=2968083 RepID=A0ABY5KQH2_9CELL|nr:PadR family transcriptional regulator [Cellulomonas xiejunii]MCC2322720.1 PadR family transcriptional regulator [Cellulomonas xiejunii]UUI72752.1 PadR family transcriptional regulator [Cellulomonas xiejunii]
MRLRSRGWGDMTWQESPTGRPRRYHRLTDPGRAARGAFVEVWRHYRTAVDRLLEGPPARPRSPPP